MVWRILLDGGKEACRGSCDNDARSDGEDGEEGGSLCEHGVNCGVVLGLEVVDIKESGGKKGWKEWVCSSKEWEVAGVWLRKVVVNECGGRQRVLCYVSERRTGVERMNV